MRIGVALGMNAKSPEFFIECDSATTVAAFKGLVLTNLPPSKAFFLLGAKLIRLPEGKLVGGNEWRGQRFYNTERGGFPTPAGGFTSDADESALYDAEGNLILLPDEAAAKATHNAAAAEADALSLEQYGVADGDVISILPHLRSGGALFLM